MTDIREQVARAIYQPDTGHEGDWDKESVGKKFHYRQLAGAAIAVADPAIRAQVIEELAGVADRLDAMTAPGRRWFANDIADWLRAQADEPDDRKIYIGFKQEDKQKDKEGDK